MSLLKAPERQTVRQLAALHRVADATSASTAASCKEEPACSSGKAPVSTVNRDVHRDVGKRDVSVEFYVDGLATFVHDADVAVGD